MDTLTRFNQQILQCQDDAYTLAWYLLGDEVAADAVMQKAVESAYHCLSEHHGNCRMLILKQVVNQCREHNLATRGSTPTDIPFDLDRLDITERLVLALVDILGMNYVVTTFVIERPVQDISRLLAQARRKIIAQKEFTTP